MQNVAFILIFIAHFTISDATKEFQQQKLPQDVNSDQDILQSVFKSSLP